MTAIVNHSQPTYHILKDAHNCLGEQMAVQKRSKTRNMVKTRNEREKKTRAAFV